jgi:hypothetical protein
MRLYKVHRDRAAQLYEAAQRAGFEQRSTKYGITMARPGMLI